MFFAEFVFALAIALLLTGFFFVAFRYRGPWDVWWLFLVVIFLAAWAGGLWIEPIGPPLFEIYWLPFLLVGLLFALILAAAVPPRPPRLPGRPRAPRTPRTRRAATPTTPAEEETALAVGLFFWLMLVSLMVVILIGYTL
ncbi:MAG: hypothetical protein ACLFTI_11970 [Anaerolineales bacterium]